MSWNNVFHCWRHPGVAGLLMKPTKVCFAFLLLLWAALGQTYLQKGHESSCAVFPSAVEWKDKKDGWERNRSRIATVLWCLSSLYWKFLHEFPISFQLLVSSVFLIQTQMLMSTCLVCPLRTSIRVLSIKLLKWIGSALWFQQGRLFTQKH